jgi:hypothetical protein
MRLVIKAGPDGLWWTLTRSSIDDRPVAKAVNPCRDVEACRTAVAVLSGPGLHKAPVQDADRRWRWQVSDAQGTVVAESADAFDSAAACGYALYELRHQLALGTAAQEIGLASPRRWAGEYPASGAPARVAAA